MKQKNELFGQVPPNAKGLEDAVIGSILLVYNGLANYVDTLKPEYFYSENNKKIFTCIKQLRSKKQEVDLLTVIERLKHNKWLEDVGGAYTVSKIASNVVSSYHIETHVDFIIKKYIMRECIKIGGNLLNEAYNDADYFGEKINETVTKLTKLTSLLYNIDELTIAGESVSSILDNILLHQSKGETITGLETPFLLLNEHTSGFKDNELIIIAARPGCGKTAFTLQIAKHSSVNKGVPVAVYNLEMGKDSLVKRLLSNETGIGLKKFNNATLDESDFSKINNSDAFVSAPLYICENANITITYLCNSIRKAVREYGCKLIIIDYLQLVKCDVKQGNREQEIAYMSREIKLLNKELQVPIILLSQMSRSVESRGAKDGIKMPQLSDLRESGAIEQDADAVYFLTPLEDLDALDEFGKTIFKKEIEVILCCEKNRSGAKFKQKFIFEGSIQRFTEVNESNYSYKNINSYEDIKQKNLKKLDFRFE